MSYESARLSINRKSAAVRAKTSLVPKLDLRNKGSIRYEG